ncbi:MAG: CDP-glucose 4,6-dehydratase [Lachnospiraceae bacterium]|nr:CDP-glucose 4,6-dehydratase [Lachnospiraceae bacterium]
MKNSENVTMNMDFYKGRKVLITGHTGFKGSWMCRVLIKAGAVVSGYAMEPPTDPALFELAGIRDRIDHETGDIRDLEHLRKVFDRVQPEVVIHMAAQPIVRDSYKDPVYTYETNVMGTVNILECVRQTPSVKSFVNVTTDKVYLNKEWPWGYRENEELNGYDPYSNSKSCSELVTSSYRNSFFEDKKVAITTCRAGNVLGGGDFANDRIIPDCIRALAANREIIVRNPDSTRPYQHVLEPVCAYLMIAARQYEDLSLAGCYNVGPDDTDCRTTGEIVQLFCDKWNELGDPDKKAAWRCENDGGPHEANFLRLDCSLIKNTFGWKPRWNVETTMDNIVRWSKAYFDGAEVAAVMDSQIDEYLLNT